MLVHIALRAIAVLTALNLGQRRLRAAAHSRQPPGVRVSLLELPGTAVDADLADLLPGRVVLAERRQGRPVALSRELVQGGADVIDLLAHRHLLVHPLEEAALQLRP